MNAPSRESHLPYTPHEKGARTLQFAVPESALIISSRWMQLFELLVYPNKPMIKPDLQRLISATTNLATPLYADRFSLRAEVSLQTLQAAVRFAVRLTAAHADAIVSANIEDGFLERSGDNVLFSPDVVNLSRAVVGWRAGEVVYIYDFDNRTLSAAPYWFGMHRWLPREQQRLSHHRALLVHAAQLAKDFPDHETEMIVRLLQTELVGFHLLTGETPETRRFAQDVLLLGDSVARDFLDQLQS